MWEKFYIQIAKLYTEKWELSVIPLTQGEKTPAIKWQEYQKRLPTTEELENWKFGNIAIVTGTVSKLVVFDADTEEAIKFIEQFNDFLETKRVKTKRGKHYYFTVPDLPPEFGCQKIYKGEVKIDLKANGGYVVAPPSIVGGHIYLWENNDEETTTRPFKTISFAHLQKLIEQIKRQLGIQDEKEEKQGKKQKETKTISQKVDFEKLKEIILKHYERGYRQDIALYTAGLLAKARVDEETAKDFIAEICSITGDEETKKRLEAVRETYKKFRQGKREDIKGFEGLIEIGFSIEELKQCFREVKIPIKLKDLTKEKIAEIIEKLDYNIDYDTFYVKFFVNDEELTEEHEDSIHTSVENFLQRRIPKEYIQDGISHCAYTHRRDRLKEYLMSCKEKWEKDGQNRLEYFFYYVFGVEPTEYVKTISKNFFIGAVARALNPGVFVKNILVIQGPQDLGKSRALASLGGKWYREINISITTEKDFYMAIQGVWLAELPEMDALRKADRNRVKAIISAPIDRFRPPYSRVVRDFPRRCIFICTTNDDEIYDDPTGGSRFWPIRVENKANIDWILENRDLLWGEAVYRYLQGESYWEVNEEVRKEQERVRRVDEWESLIKEWLEKTERNEVTIAEIAEVVLDIKIKDLSKSVQMRIADCLRVLGYERKQVWEDNIVKWKWFKKE